MNRRSAHLSVTDSIQHKSVHMTIIVPFTYIMLHSFLSSSSIHLHKNPLRKILFPLAKWKTKLK